MYSPRPLCSGPALCLGSWKLSSDANSIFVDYLLFILGQFRVSDVS